MNCDATVALKGIVLAQASTSLALKTETEFSSNKRKHGSSVLSRAATARGEAFFSDNEGRGRANTAGRATARKKARLDRNMSGRRMERATKTWKNNTGKMGKRNTKKSN